MAFDERNNQSLPFSHQELVDVHRRVDGDLPPEVVFELVLAAAGRGRVAEELGEALRSFFFDVDDGRRRSKW